MGKHTAGHVMHVNSLETFQSLDLNEREALVLSAYLLARAPLSDREAQRALGLPERGMVQPRVTNLIDRGLLWECGSAVCSETGRKVRTCLPTSLARREPKRDPRADVIGDPQ